MHYRIRKDKIFTASPTSGLLVLHRHVVLCDGPKLQLCAFNCGDTRMCWSRQPFLNLSK